jgi:hypothetical protein
MGKSSQAGLSQKCLSQPGTKDHHALFLPLQGVDRGKPSPWVRLGKILVGLSQKN